MNSVKPLESDPVKRCWTCAIIAIVSVISSTFLIFDIARLIVGINYQFLCPIQSYIPIWLIASASLGIFFNFFFTASLYISYLLKSAVFNFIMIVIFTIIGLGLLAWFIAGNVWVFSVTNLVQFLDTYDSRTYCHSTVYLFSFWSIIATYIIMAFILVILSIWLCISLCNYSRRTEYTKS